MSNQKKKPNKIILLSSEGTYNDYIVSDDAFKKIKQLCWDDYQQWKQQHG